MNITDSVLVNVEEMDLLLRVEKYARGLIEDDHINLGLNDGGDLADTLAALDKLRSDKRQ